MTSVGKIATKTRTNAAHAARLIVTRENPSSIVHAIRTAVAAVASLLIARLFRLPEAYWSSISTLVIMQSTVGASLPISAQRFAGTAFGAVVGGFIGSHFPCNALAFGLSVFVIGLVCAAFSVQRTSYRYATITLAIVMLVTHAQNRWAVAAHRFTEVSIGIAVGLAMTAIWPERRAESVTPVASEARPVSTGPPS